MKLSYYSISLSFILLLFSHFSMANNCQVNVLTPEINLGSQHADNSQKVLFPQRMIVLSANCEGIQPITIVADGVADDKGDNFKLGDNGTINMTLISAKCNGKDAVLYVQNPGQDHRAYHSGSSQKISPRTKIEMDNTSCYDKNNRQLIMQFQLDFPAVIGHPPTRDIIKQSGQIVFNLLS